MRIHCTMHMHDILKAKPFKKCVKSNNFKLCFKTFSDFDAGCNINESEFQQSSPLPDSFNCFLIFWLYVRRVVMSILKRT